MIKRNKELITRSFLFNRLSQFFDTGLGGSAIQQSNKNRVTSSVVVMLLSLLVAPVTFGENLASEGDYPHLENASDGQSTSQIPEPNLENIKAGTLFLSDTQQFVDAPALESSVEMSISGIVASVTLEQTFTNQGGEWVEGLYAFPLPDNAAINGLTIKVGERTIEGQIQEKSAARKIYQTARDQGKIAGLVRQHRPNLFSSRIANIGPGKTVRVSLRYVQTIQLRDDQFSLRFPMTLTPRYLNKQVPDPLDISPPQLHHSDIIASSGNQSLMTVNLTLHGTKPLGNLASPSHQLQMQRYEDRVEIQTIGPVPMNQDFLFNWTYESNIEPSISSWRERVGEHEYLLTMVAPPNVDSTSQSIARELILVIDTSGSMAGESLLAAQQALGVAIDGLRIEDRFNIIAFDSNVRRLFPAAVDVNEETLEIARRFTTSLRADGGTEMEPALRSALANPTQRFLRQVVFITDGSVGNENHLYSVIEQHLRDSRLFTVGIGSAPNAWFMKKAANSGRGTYTFISNAEEAQAKMSTLFRKLERPALTNLAINWLGDTADYAPAPIPDIYLGEPLVIAARLNPMTTGLRIHGTLVNNEWEQSINLDQTPLVNTGLSTIWAKQKIETLLEEQRRSGTRDLYKDTITLLAIEHQITSPYTSFIAVDKTPSRPSGEPLQAKSIPNLMPAGSTMQAVNYPQGAAGSDTLLLICFLALVILGMIKTGCLQRDKDHASFR